MLNAIEPLNNLSSSDIQIAIQNCTGPRPSLFVPEQAFDMLIRPQIKRLLEPCQRCLEGVFDQLLKILEGCDTKELSRFPMLRQEMHRITHALLRERLPATQQYIESLIQIQCSYINTNHPDFLQMVHHGGMTVERHAKQGSKVKEPRDRTTSPVRRQQPSILSSVTTVFFSFPCSMSSTVEN